MRVGRGEHRSGHVCCVEDVYVGHADARLAAVDQWPAVAALTLLFPNWKGTLGYSESRLIYYRIASLIAKFACFNLVRKNHQKRADNSGLTKCLTLQGDSGGRVSGLG